MVFRGSVKSFFIYIYLLYAYICVYFMALDRKYIKFSKLLNIIDSICCSLHWIFGASLHCGPRVTKWVSFTSSGEK